MKPKKKVRKSGYYWVKYGEDARWFMAEYYPSGDYFMLTGNIMPYRAKELSYISTRPLKPGKK